jgi:predicted O-methyltransferase YrrM
MKSVEYLKKFPKRKYDYIHIDGDHSYKGVAADFEMFWPLLKKGGFLAIHDIGSPDKDGNVYGTRKFWKEIKEKPGTKYFEFLEDPGVGVIQK